MTLEYIEKAIDTLLRKKGENVHRYIDGEWVFVSNRAVTDNAAMWVNEAKKPIIELYNMRIPDERKEIYADISSKLHFIFNRLEDIPDDLSYENTKIIMDESIFNLNNIIDEIESIKG